MRSFEFRVREFPYPRTRSIERGKESSCINLVSPVKWRCMRLRCVLDRLTSFAISGPASTSGWQNSFLTFGTCAFVQLLFRLCQCAARNL